MPFIFFVPDKRAGNPARDCLLSYPVDTREKAIKYRDDWASRFDCPLEETFVLELTIPPEEYQAQRGEGTAVAMDKALTLLESDITAKYEESIKRLQDMQMLTPSIDRNTAEKTARHLHKAILRYSSTIDGPVLTIPLPGNKFTHMDMKAYFRDRAGFFSEATPAETIERLDRDIARISKADSHVTPATQAEVEDAKVQLEAREALVKQAEKKCLSLGQVVPSVLPLEAALDIAKHTQRLVFQRTTVEGQPRLSVVMPNGSYIKDINQEWQKHPDHFFTTSGALASLESLAAPIPGLD